MAQTKCETSFPEPSKGMNYTRKMIVDLKESLRKAREGWKKTKDDLRESLIKNISLAKEHAKEVNDGYSAMHVSFENALNQVEHFYPIVHISWELVLLDLEMVNVELVFVMDDSDT